MGHRDLSALGRRLKNSQADLERRFAPSAVVKNRPAVRHSFIELRNFRLAAHDCFPDRDFFFPLVTVNEDAVRRLPHVPLRTAHDGETKKFLVLSILLLLVQTRPAMRHRSLADTARAVAHLLLKLFELFFPTRPGDFFEAVPRVSVGLGMAQVSSLSHPPKKFCGIEETVAVINHGSRNSILEFEIADMGSLR